MVIKCTVSKIAGTNQLRKTQKLKVEKGSTITAHALSDDFILQTLNDHWRTFLRAHGWLGEQAFSVSGELTARASWEDKDGGAPAPLQPSGARERERRGVGLRPFGRRRCSEG